MYLVYDREVENHTWRKRFASPFYDKNWTVALGWKKQGDSCCSWGYYPTKEDEVPLQIDKDITMLVGLNIKFDLLYGWRDTQLQDFFKRGGKIWCCQYAEYLLEGQVQSAHMVSMDKIVEKYGGRKKVDEVKLLWEAGFLTSAIDKDLLIDYLVGTEEEGRNSGDVGNTELIFLGQIKRAVEQGMLKMIMARMDGLLATTEMEYNGLKIDVHEAKRRMIILERELSLVDTELSANIPTLPEGLEFNWNSGTHKSCLIFGGTVKYKKSDYYIDDKTGELARLKATEDHPLFYGEPIDIKECTYKDGLYYHNNVPQDLYLSGRKKGDPKFKKVSVPGDLKTKIQDFFFEFEGFIKPDPKWQSSMTDGKDDPIYYTNDDVLKALGKSDIPFLKAMAKRQAILKDLGTYYMRYDPKIKDYKGMLTCVLPVTHIVNHSLNHTSTVTSRLSSSNPNLQNIPRGDPNAKEDDFKSETKKMFISRFENGKMMEVDYSQLEVVVMGLLSKDKQLVEDLNNKVDFHCKRVAAWRGCTYEEALEWCKNDEHPKYPEWKVYRTLAKVFSFQRAYGAGANLIAEYTGMDIDDVKALITAEETMYPGVVSFNTSVEQAVKETAKPFKDLTDQKIYYRGQWQAPTGTIYKFRSYDSNSWQKERGIDSSFMPTELKNYPIQGTGGEIVQIILGKLWRHFVETDNYGGKALLCNTVHDCVWLDYSPDVENKLVKNVTSIMESVPEVLNTLYGMDVPVPFPVEAEAGINMYTLTHIKGE